MRCWLSHIWSNPARHGRPVGAETPAGNANLRSTQRGVVCNGGHSETVCTAREDSMRASVCVEIETSSSAIAACLRSKLSSNRVWTAWFTESTALCPGVRNSFQESPDQSEKPERDPEERVCRPSRPASLNCARSRQYRQAGPHL